MQIRFGEFVVDGGSRQLTRHGVVVHLSPKAFDLHVKLVTDRPRAVPKADLLSHLWPDTFVSEANLPMLVGEVRQALGDSVAAPRFIRTVPRFGYAFSAAAVELVDADAGLPVGPRAWLVIGRDRLILAEGANVLGREPGCQAWINAPGVSRHHARIVITGDAATLEDLESKNGTYVDGARLTGLVALVDGATITLGSFLVVFRTWSATPTTETQQSTGVRHA